MGTDSIVFDRAASFYDETRGFPPGEEKRIAALISRVGGWTQSSHIIEIGVGTGRIALPLAAHVATIDGVDLSRPMMERLRAKQSAEKIHLAEADITRLPFKSGNFDGAVAVHIFHLVPGWRQALHELARVLRPGAVLVFAKNARRHTLFEFESAELGADMQRVVGAAARDNDQFLLEEGWRPAGDEQKHEFKLYEAPQDYLNQLQSRSWSRTWRMTDEELARVLEAARAEIQKRFADPNQPIELASHFQARAYLPPAHT